MTISQEFNGDYRIIITDKNGMINDTGWINNLVLNSGLDKMGSLAAAGGGSPISYIRLGTGTSTPIATQTSLDNQIASAECYPITSASNSSTFRCLFSQGQISGTITEVGSGWTASGPTLYSRSKLVTPILILSTDQVEILYTVKSNPPTMAPGSVIINGISYAYTSYYARGPGDFNGKTTVGTAFPSQSKVTAVFGIGANPGTTSSYYGYAVAGFPPEPFKYNGNYNPFLSLNPPQPGGITYNTSTYVPGTYYLDCTSSWFSSSYAPNPATVGIRGLWITYSNLAYQLYFNTPIPKTGNSTISLTLRSSWAAGGPSTF